MTPAVSILMPVYNGERFLPEQVDSILAQSFGDFELLAYDDGSADGSVDLLRDYARRDTRVRALTGTVNMGQPAALKRLVREAAAPLLAFSDQDDIWHADKLALLASAIDGHALAYGLSRLVDGEGGELGCTLFDFVGPGSEGSDDLRLLFHNTVSGHAMLARRDIVEPAVFGLQRTYDWMIATVASFAGGIALQPAAVTLHRQHGGNQTNRLLAPPRPDRSRWARHIRHVGERRQNRLHLIESLGFLAACDAIAPDRRRLFARMRAVVENEIMTGGSSLRGSDFVARFMECADGFAPDDAMRADVEKSVRRLRMRFGSFR